MNLEQFKKQYQTYNQIQSIFIENKVPFFRSEDHIEIWLEDTIVFLYSNNKYYRYYRNMKDSIKTASKRILQQKERIQEYSQKYMVFKSNDSDNVNYIYDIIGCKMYIIKLIQLKEMAEFYESRTI